MFTERRPSKYYTVNEMYNYNFLRQNNQNGATNEERQHIDDMYRRYEMYSTFGDILNSKYLSQIMKEELMLALDKAVKRDPKSVKDSDEIRHYVNCFTYVIDKCKTLNMYSVYTLGFLKLVVIRSVANELARKFAFQVHKEASKITNKDINFFIGQYMVASRRGLMSAFRSHAGLKDDVDGDDTYDHSEMYIYSRKLAKSVLIVLSENIETFFSNDEEKALQTSAQNAVNNDEDEIVRKNESKCMMDRFDQLMRDVNASGVDEETCKVTYEQMTKSFFDNNPDYVETNDTDDSDDEDRITVVNIIADTERFESDSNMVADDKPYDIPGDDDTNTEDEAIIRWDTDEEESEDVDNVFEKDTNVCDVDIYSQGDKSVSDIEIYSQRNAKVNDIEIYSQNDANDAVLYKDNTNDDNDAALLSVDDVNVIFTVNNANDTTSCTNNDVFAVVLTENNDGDNSHTVMKNDNFAACAETIKLTSDFSSDVDIEDTAFLGEKK